MTENQRAALSELRRSAWDVGFAYGLEGKGTAEMLLQVAAETGCDEISPWIAKHLVAGHAAGAEDAQRRRTEEAAAVSVVRIAGIPW